MSWAPVHGCAIALPRRSPQRCGVRQHGPRPSQMFMALQKDSMLMWVYLSASPDGGAEAVADFLLAQLEIGMKVNEMQQSMKLLRQCQSWMVGIPGAKDPLLDFCLSRETTRARQKQNDAEAAWAKRKAQIVARDEARRRGPVRQHLERQMIKPPAPEPPTPKKESMEDRMRKAWWRHYHEERRRTASVGAMA